MNVNLEMNRFLERRNREGANEEEESKQIISKIKKAQLGKDEEITATKQLSQRDYNLFKKGLNNINYELYNALKFSKTGKDDFNFIESTSNIISDWNLFVSTLSRIKYNQLMPNIRQQLYDDIKELKPSLLLLVQYIKDFININGDTDYKGLDDRIANIISQIDADIYSSVSYPLKEIVLELDQPEGGEEE